MRIWNRVAYALSLYVATASLAGCGGPETSMGSLAAMPQTSAIGPARSIVHSMLPALSYQVMHRFAGGSRGANPSTGLIDVHGELYGTTAYGGGSACSSGCGTVYRISTSGTAKVLYRFAGGSDGAVPAARLLNVNGTLYGTTVYGGGSSNYGTVFSLSTAGAEKVLYRFAGGSDGAGPSDLIEVNGTLYGTTNEGGNSRCRYGCGTVFSISQTGAETVLYRFTGGSSDGEYPGGGLLNVHGTLYGTTHSGGSGSNCRGGAYGCGTVFSISTTGTEKVLYNFVGGSDGANPSASLIHLRGTLYGTTYSGGGHTCGSGRGASACGTVFSVSTLGAESVLYQFAGGSDGAHPESNLIAVKGMLYGTTYEGGSKNCIVGQGCGTIFSASATGAESVLYRFAGGTSDGEYPEAGLLNVHGTLYGTTTAGGGRRACSGEGCGTVFSLTP